MRQEVGRHARRHAPAEVGRRADHGEALPWPERHRDHVLRHDFGEADAGVEAISDDVDQAPLGDDVDLHLRVAPQVFEHDRRHHLARRAGRGVDAQGAARRAAVAAGLLHRAADRAECRRHAGDELLAGLRQRDAARGAVEQAHADARLQRRHGVAQRRGRHAQLHGGSAEAAPPRHRQHCLEFGQSRPHYPDFRNR